MNEPKLVTQTLCFVWVPKFKVEIPGIMLFGIPRMKKYFPACDEHKKMSYMGFKPDGIRLESLRVTPLLIVDNVLMRAILFLEIVTFTLEKFDPVNLF